MQSRKLKKNIGQIWQEKFIGNAMGKNLRDYLLKIIMNYNNKSLPFANSK